MRDVMITTQRYRQPGTIDGYCGHWSICDANPMAKVFYLGGGTHSRGVLRAVVTVEQLNSLISADGVSYMGTVFPEHEFVGPVTVVEISRDETTEPWATGFSRINKTPTEFDERLKFLPESEEPPKKPAHQERRNGSSLIHWLTSDMRSGD